MKFAKQLEKDTENLPDELRQHLIRYKYLKKAISKIVEEMQQRGISATLLSEWLRKSNHVTESEEDETLKIEYFFVGTFCKGPSSSERNHTVGQLNTNTPCFLRKGQPPNIRTCIKVTYLENDPRVQQLLQPAKNLADGSDEQSGALEYRYSRNDTDYFSLSPPAAQTPLDGSSEEKIARRRRSSSSSSKLAKTLLELSLKGPETPSHQPIVRGKLCIC